MTRYGKTSGAYFPTHANSDWPISFSIAASNPRKLHVFTHKSSAMNEKFLAYGTTSLSEYYSIRNKYLFLF